MGTEQQVIVSRERSTMVVTINRPSALNSITFDTVGELNNALEQAGSDRSIRSVVLTASGERAFCAGIDVKAVAKRDAEADAGPLDAEQVERVEQVERAERVDPVVAGFENLHYSLSSVIRAIHRLAVPVIAAVNGHAIGAGFAFAAASDLRLGSVNATFADGFVKRGISGCELGLSYFLPKIVGPAQAFDLMMTGRRVGAQEAFETGLIGELTEPGELVEKALEKAAMLAANAPMSITMTKEVMWANLQAPSLDHALAMESRTQSLTRLTADAAEARAAFIEKRSPNFGVPSEPRPLGL